MGKLLIAKIIFVLLNLIYTAIMLAAWTYKLVNTFVIFIVAYLIIMLICALWGVIVNDIMALVAHFIVNLVVANFFIVAHFFLHFFWRVMADTILAFYWDEARKGYRFDMNEIENDLSCCGFDGIDDYKNNGMIPNHQHCNLSKPRPGCIQVYRSYFEEFDLPEFIIFAWVLFVLLLAMIANCVILILVRMRVRERQVNERNSL